MRKINQVQNDVLILTGEEDKIVLQENCLRLTKLLVNSSVSIIRNCGHFLLYDDLKPYLPKIIDFVGKTQKTMNN